MAGYNSNTNLKGVGVNLELTEDQFKEYFKCSIDPVYFIQKYCKIISVDKGLIPFTMYPAQKDLVKTIHDNRKVAVLMGRQLGKCHISSTKYKVINNFTGETLYVTAKQFHEICENS